MKLDKRIFSYNNQTYSDPWHPNCLSQKRVEKVLELVGSGNRVLDIGCFDGTITKSIQRLGNQVVGIDISKRALQLARKKGLETVSLNFETDKLPPGLGKFDIVVASEILEHIFDTSNFLKKIHRVLRPAGQLVLTTPNLAGLGSRISLILGHSPWMVEDTLGEGTSGHIRYFTPGSLDSLLQATGFKTINFSTDSVGFGPNLSLPFLDLAFPSLGRIIVVKAQRV